MRTFVIVSVAVFAAGCGPSGPTRYDLSGKALYDGQPIPAGQIAFEPDADKGNEGPRGTGRIENGQYKTLPDKGTIGGPHKVKIFGYDGKEEPGSGSPDGASLFPMYQTEVDLPREPTTHDFDVPR